MNIEITLKELNGKQIPAVTSLQVAEIFGKQHAHVLRDIAQILTQVPENFIESNFGCVEYPVKRGFGTEMTKAYLLSKDGFILLTMGYTGEKAMKFKVDYINRFNEMEEQLRSGSPAIPDFQNPALAARAWAEQYERRQIAEAQRDEAIRARSWINEGRTAKAMADKLGEGKHWKQVKAIPWLLEVFHESAGMYSQVGRKLSQLGERMGLQPRITEDSHYGTVKIHHAEVIEALRLALKQDHNLLGKYRKMKAA